MQEWKAGAERLLVATAGAAGLTSTDVLGRPRDLVPAFDGLLANVDLSELVEDEFFSLNAH